MFVIFIIIISHHNHNYCHRNYNYKHNCHRRHHDGTHLCQQGDGKGTGAVVFLLLPVFDQIMKITRFS